MATAHRRMEAWDHDIMRTHGVCLWQGGGRAAGAAAGAGGLGMEALGGASATLTAAWREEDAMLGPQVCAAPPPACFGCQLRSRQRVHTRTCDERSCAGESRLPVSSASLLDEQVTLMCVCDVLCVCSWRRCRRRLERVWCPSCPPRRSPPSSAECSVIVYRTRRAVRPSSLYLYDTTWIP